MSKEYTASDDLLLRLCLGILIGCAQAESCIYYGTLSRQLGRRHKSVEVCVAELCEIQRRITLWCKARQMPNLAILIIHDKTVNATLPDPSVWPELGLDNLPLAKVISQAHLQVQAVKRYWSADLNV